MRSRLADTPNRLRSLEERLLETKGQLAQKTAQNEKLSYTLREAREHIASLRDEVDKLTQPPNAYGVVVGKNDDGTVDVLASGRKMKVQLHPEIEHDQIGPVADKGVTERIVVGGEGRDETTVICDLRNKLGERRLVIDHQQPWLPHARSLPRP